MTPPSGTKTNFFDNFGKYSFHPNIQKKLFYTDLQKNKMGRTKQVGRKKVNPTSSYVVTKNQKYSEFNCNKCLQPKMTYQIYHQCMCHCCQDWYGCSSPNDWQQIFFVCKDCDYFKPISEKDEKKIKFPLQVQKEEAEERQRKIRYQKQQQIRERQLYQTAFKSKRQLDNFGNKKCKFGKYKSKSWNSIWKDDPAYITEFILSTTFNGSIKYKVSKWFQEL